MPVLHQLQPSFNNGEISPLLYDRVDYNKFTSSVKSGKNMFVHPQGGMSNRAGTKMLGMANGEKVRLIPFEFSNTETYMIEFGDFYCRFYTTNGQVVTEDGNPYEIESPFKTEDLDKIRYCQSADVMYIAWGGKPKTLTRYGHTNWKFEDYDYKDGPYDTNREEKGVFFQSKENNDLYSDLAVFNGFKVYGLNKDNGYWSNSSLSTEIDGWSELSFTNGIFFKRKGQELYKSDKLYGFEPIVGFVFEEGEKLVGVLSKNEPARYFIATTHRLFYSDDLVSFTQYYNAKEEIGEGFVFSMAKLVVNAPIFLGNIEVDGVQRGYLISDWYGNVNGIGYVEGSTLNHITDDGKIVGGSKIFTVDSYNSTNKIFTDTGLTSTSGLVCGPIYWKNNYYYFAFGNDQDSVGKVSPIYFSIDNGSSWKQAGFSNISWQEGTSTAKNICRNLLDARCFIEGYDLKIDVLYEFGMFSASFYDYDSENVFVRNSVLTIYFYNNTDGYVYGRAFFVKGIDYSAASPNRIVVQNEFFKNEDVGKLVGLEARIPAMSLSKTVVGSAEGFATYTSEPFYFYGSWRLKTTGTWHGTVGVEISDDLKTWTVYDEYTTDKKSNYDIVGDYGLDICWGRVFYKSLEATEGDENTAYIDFSRDSFLTSFYGKIEEVLNPVSAKIIPSEHNFISIEDFNSSRGKVFLGVWGDNSYYPTEVDLYQDRIVWATNNQLDATKISDYTNFDVSAEVTADDAISVIIKDKKINKINSAIAGSQLVVFTDSGNFIHNNETFTPSTATFLNQGSTGGADVKPVIVRDNIIYVHPMKQAISDYAYSFETDGYAGQDITILANHLFDNKKIKELAYQQEPYSIIWVLQEEGTMLACTYLRQQNVIAWTPMDFGGKVLSVGVMSNGSNQELYLAVERKNGVFIEKMPYRMLDNDPKERFFVDCGSTYRGEPANIIAGLEYLEGESVVALADGYVVKDLVVENGQITLPTPASIVTVGLPYESVLETLTFDVSQGDGSNLNRKKRVVAVSVRYNNSRGSRISVNGHREVPMLERKIENTDTDISLKSGFYREILPSAHNEPTTIKIRQDEPLPLTIVSIIPELEYER